MATENNRITPYFGFSIANTRTATSCAEACSRINTCCAVSYNYLLKICEVDLTGNCYLTFTPEPGWKVYHKGRN